VRGEQRVDPAGRTASGRDDGDDLSEHVEPVLESAVGARLHDAEQVGLPHALDHVVPDAAIGFRLLRPLPRELRDRTRSRQKVGNIGLADRRLESLN
jgi:hypothetical protein